MFSQDHGTEMYLGFLSLYFQRIETKIEENTSGVLGFKAINFADDQEELRAKDELFLDRCEAHSSFQFFTQFKDINGTFRRFFHL